MKKWFIGFVLVLATLFTSVMAEDNPRAVIIFDASGSMWGQINGVTKIEIARDALKNVVREWNPSVELGLTVYGHRSKGDCNDIESVIPVGKVNKNKVIRTVMSIKPKGKTPISRSLRKVAEEIKYTEEKATIILISDGKETCDPDPCGTAKELEAQGIDFVTHVIGFNVDKKTDKQLECIANATGGEYFSAKNAVALNKAMKVIAKKVEVVVPPKPVVKKLKNNLEVTASETEGGKWIEASHHLFKIVDGEKENRGGHWSYKKKPLIKQLPVGKYIFESSYSGLTKETAFEIKAGEVTKLHIIMGSTGKVEVTASETEGGKWIEASHHLFKIVDGEKENGGGHWSYKKKPLVKQLPVGKYIFESSYNDFKVVTPFEIKPGEVTKIHVVMGQTGKVEITASEKEGGKWIEAYHTVHKVIDGEADSSRTAGCYSKKKKECLKQIPVGKYVMHSTYNDFKQKTNFEVKSGEVTKIHVVMGQTGKVEITASEKEGGKWIEAYHTVHKVIDGEADSSRTAGCYSKKKKECLKQIPVGKYVMHSTYNDFKKETAFEIKAGEVTKIHVVMGETGTVETSASEKEGGKWVSAYHNIFEDEEGKAGDLVTRAPSQKKNAGKKQIPVGKYILKSSYNDFKKETAFEIKAGEVTKVHVVMGETGTIETSASEKEGGKWIGAYHNIVQDEDGKAGDLVARANSQKKNTGKSQIPVGKYILESSYKSFKKETPFEVKAGETTKIHVTFGQFFIEAKCINMGNKISYEIYASSGQLVDEKTIKCSDALKITLDNGDYSVEAKVGSDTKEVKFTVGGSSSKLLIDMTDIKREPTKEELIKADSQETPVTTEVKTETTSTVNTVVESKSQEQHIDTLDIDVNEVKKSLGQLGALFGGAGGIQKSIESKPLQGIKESLIVALPYMEKTKECFGASQTLEDAQLCDVIANEGAKKAQEKMESVVGIKGKMAKTINHTEWNEAIRVKELAREEKDVKNAKLYIICIDKGVGMGQLKECAANNGEFKPKKTEIEQLGDMLKMFGGMK